MASGGHGSTPPPTDGGVDSSPSLPSVSLKHVDKGSTYRAQGGGGGHGKLTTNNPASIAWYSKYQAQFGGRLDPDPLHASPAYKIHSYDSHIAEIRGKAYVYSILLK